MNSNAEELLRGSLKASIVALETISMLIEHVNDPDLVKEYLAYRLQMLQKIEKYVNNATP